MLLDISNVDLPTCTGGQHRSVYSAQHVAEYISNKFGCEVQLIHREQHIEEHYEAK